MNEDIIASRYGAAFFQASFASGVAESCQEELKSFLELLQEQDKLKATLSHPLISRKAKVAIWEKISPRLGFQKITSRFLSLLIEKNRLSYLERINDFFRDFLAESQQLRRVTLQLAAPLEEQEKGALQERIKTILKLENTEFSISYDDRLIAGMVIAYGDQVIDGSLSGRLRNLHQQLIQ